MEPFWTRVAEATLRQGDYLPGCLVPVLPTELTVGAPIVVSARPADLIVVTQSCDLEKQKVRLVAMVSILRLDQFEAINPAFRKRGRWNEVLKGRSEGLYLLGSPTNPSNNLEALVVDFREIISLPMEMAAAHAARLGPRWRLKSPFLEHFSQAFARFFMRVGLPSTIPEFR